MELFKELAELLLPLPPEESIYPVAEDDVSRSVSGATLVASVEGLERQWRLLIGPALQKTVAPATCSAAGLGSGSSGSARSIYGSISDSTETSQLWPARFVARHTMLQYALQLEALGEVRWEG